MELNGLARQLIWGTDEDTGKLITTNKDFGDTGVASIDIKTAKGATTANITGLNPTVTKVYGSNTIGESEIGVENISVTVGANDVPFGIASALMGLIEDTENGGYKKAEKALFHGGLIVQTNHGNDKAYIAFPYGTWTAGAGLNLQTDAANPVTVHDSFTFSPQARPEDGLLYQMFVDDGTNANFSYEKMLTYIIDGYKPASK